MLVEKYFLQPVISSACCDFGVNGFIQKYIFTGDMDGFLKQEYSDFSTEPAGAGSLSKMTAGSAWCHEVIKFFFLPFRNPLVCFLPEGRESPTATINRKKKIPVIFSREIKPLVLFSRAIFIFLFLKGEML